MQKTDPMSYRLANASQKYLRPPPHPSITYPEAIYAKAFRSWLGRSMWVV